MPEPLGGFGRDCLRVAEGLELAKVPSRPSINFMSFLSWSESFDSATYELTSLYALRPVDTLPLGGFVLAGLVLEGGKLSFGASWGPIVGELPVLGEEEGAGPDDVLGESDLPRGGGEGLATDVSGTDKSEPDACAKLPSFLPGITAEFLEEVASPC